MRATADTLTISSIIELVGRHAMERGDAVAIEDAHDKLTYRQLDERSTTLARAVRESVVGRQEAVALLIDHGVRQYVAVIGVLKSDHICLPLEPMQPERRLGQIVQHARPAAIVTDDANRHVAERLAGGDLPVVFVDDIPEERGSLSDADIERHDPALILYTSGSTGRPKGVLHTHANIVDSAVLHADNVALREDDRVSMVYSYTSSAGLKVDVVSALAVGARVCLYDLRTQGIHGVGPWLLEKKITVYHSVPEVFREFCALLRDEEMFSSVRWLQLGGAQVLWSDYDLFRRHFRADCVFANGLGATETGRVCIRVVTGDPTRNSSNMPVGRPVTGVNVRLVDEEGTDVIGSGTGQMIVSSSNLASGYWRDPELTAASFRQDADGALWYYTGDLATRTPEGMFELVGRTDFVVNVNGNRVDVSEVEHALMAVEGIKDAAVVAKESSGTIELTAFLVGDGVDGDFQGVRQTLATTLPSYMIPTNLVGVDALPMTPSGKLDRGALAAPARQTPSVSTATSATQSELAATVALIWCDVLGIEEVTGDDDFLDLGGTSLLGMRVMAEIEKRIGVTIAVMRLFEAESFREFVRMVEEVRSS